MAIVRGVLAVIIGFVVMFLVQAIGLTIGYFVVPLDKIYEGDTLRVTILWSVIMLVMVLIGSIFGGIVAALIGKSPSHMPVKILAAIILVGGLISGYFQVQEIKSRTDEQLQRTGEAKVWEAAQDSAPKNWYPFVTPVLSAAGLMGGATLIRKRPRDDFYDEPPAAE